MSNIITFAAVHLSNALHEASDNTILHCQTTAGPKPSVWPPSEQLTDPHRDGYGPKAIGEIKLFPKPQAGGHTDGHLYSNLDTRAAQFNRSSNQRGNSSKMDQNHYSDLLSILHRLTGGNVLSVYKSIIWWSWWFSPKHTTQMSTTSDSAVAPFVWICSKLTSPTSVTQCSSEAAITEPAPAPGDPVLTRKEVFIKALTP